MNTSGPGAKRRTREEEALELAETLLTDIETGESALDKLILKAVRFARLAEDDELGEWLKFEMEGYSDTEESKAWMARTQRISSGQEPFYNSGLNIAEVIASREQLLLSARIPDVSGDWALVVSNESRQYLGRIEGSLIRVKSIRAAIVGLIHRYVVADYHRLRFSARQYSMFTAARDEIDGLLVEMGPEAIKKIDSAYERITRGDAEAISQALNSCRRLIVQVGDTLFPPTTETRVLENKQVTLGEPQVLNRLKAYIEDHTSSKSRRTRLKQSIGNLFERTSSGVHASVTPNEARFIFLETYVLLGELLAMRGDGEQPALEVTVE